ncbi:MAG: 50S ribosomal protein L18 [Chloroflexi bacterium]|nr:50S ribosomal protein L18 [Chloroflexota bacterium]
MSVTTPREARYRRHRRVRARLSGTTGRPRLCVFRSLGHVYAQLIDDERGHTMATASTLDATLKNELEGKNKTEQAKLVGGLIARRGLEAGIKQVVFDRGGYVYHGRVKALAEAAREAGLVF